MCVPVLVQLLRNGVGGRYDEVTLIVVCGCCSHPVVQWCDDTVTRCERVVDVQGRTQSCSHRMNLESCSIRECSTMCPVPFPDVIKESVYCCKTMGVCSSC